MTWRTGDNKFLSTLRGGAMKRFKRRPRPIPPPPVNLPFTWDRIDGTPWDTLDLTPWDTRENG